MSLRNLVESVLVESQDKSQYAKNAVDVDKSLKK
jgi:hypothetical protein